MLNMDPLKNKKLGRFYLLFLVPALFNYLLFLILYGTFNLNYGVSGFVGLFFGIGLSLWFIKNKISEI